MRLGLLLPVALVLLLAACGDQGSGGSDADPAAEERALKETVSTVDDTLRPLVADLAAGLGGSLRFSQGNYESCGSDLDGPVAFRYDVNGRLDVPRPVAAADAETVTSVLEDAGWQVEATPTAVTATKDRLDFTIGVREGRDFLLFHGGSDRCHEVGEDRAKPYLAKRPDPLA